MPGFVDAHVHYAQIDVIASHAKQLLDWLNDYTFPAEAAFADPIHAAKAAEFFLDELLRNGTTTAAVYPTVHAASVDAFFTAAEFFPWSKSYLDVYRRFGLLRDGALYGHCIHFDESDWRQFADAGAVAVHCPTSNLFLGSGLFDYEAARRAGARVALATDVGGGTSFSMLRTMHEAYKVAQLAGRPFDSYDAFYLATLGGARGLGLEQNIGSFESGREADFVVLDPGATELLARRNRGSLRERLFALMMLGDDRAVAATYVLGEAAWKRNIL